MPDSDPHGTSLVRVKRGFIDLMAARVPNVSYQSPATASEITGDDGSGASVWWLDEADHSFDVRVMVGEPLWLDETATLTLVVQVIGSDSDATQERIDEHAARLLGHAIAVLAADPTCGVAATDDLTVHHALPARVDYSAGYLDDPSKRAAKFELAVDVDSRLKLGG